MTARTDLAAHLSRGDTVLSEGSVYELLRRDERIRFDPHIAHAGLLYDESSRGLLAGVHRTYIEVARRHALPLVVFADTWRASGERVAASPFRGRAVNRDNVEFLRGIAAAESGHRVWVGALTGPSCDAYRPDEAPSTTEAVRYHAFQVAELAGANVDLLMAATLPSFAEAKGIAQLMTRTGVPWMLSFVVRPEGLLLDGTTLADAIREIDDSSLAPPLGYSINCVHPEIAMRALSTLPPDVASRVIAFQGNTSKLPPEEIDGLAEIDSADPRAFAASIVTLVRDTRVCLIGGCCGTDERHMESVARALATIGS